MSDRPPPPDAIRVVPNVPRLSHDDVADEYAVHFDDALPGGCMVWARYDERWVCNPWSTRALTRTLLARHAAEVERVRGVESAIRSLGRTLATNARDWSLDRADAWLYGALCGWGEAMPEVAARHGWSTEDVARLEALHATLTPGGSDAR